MILIICALRLEAKPFLRALDNTTPVRLAKTKAYQGEIDGQKVMLAICGVGIKKAAATIQALIDAHDISHIIMSGTAGGIDSKLKIGDTVVSDELVFHEFDESNESRDGIICKKTTYTADAKMLAIVASFIDNDASVGSVYIGRISTGNKFVTGKNFDKISEEFHPLCADMESAAVAHVCRQNDLPFIAVRSMSDVRGKSGIITFLRYAPLAAMSSFVVVSKILRDYSFLA
jgi:adenosylhomocysteine nucleosidase